MLGFRSMVWVASYSVTFLAAVLVASTSLQTHDSSQLLSRFYKACPACHRAPVLLNAFNDHLSPFRVRNTVGGLRLVRSFQEVSDQYTGEFPIALLFYGGGPDTHIGVNAHGENVFDSFAAINCIFPFRHRA